MRLVLVFIPDEPQDAEPSLQQIFTKVLRRRIKDF